jgi:hypothetical protein
MNTQTLTINGSIAFCEAQGLAKVFQAYADNCAGEDILEVDFNPNSGYVYIALENGVTIGSMLGQEVEYIVFNEYQGEEDKGQKIKVRYIEENEIHEWTIEQILDEINRDRSENWTDYDKNDWQEGWDSWIEGEFYSLKDENGKPLNKFKDGGEVDLFQGL